MSLLNSWNLETFTPNSAIVFENVHHTHLENEQQALGLISMCALNVTEKRCKYIFIFCLSIYLFICIR